MELANQLGGSEDPITDGGQSNGSFWCEMAVQLWDIRLGKLGWDTGGKGCAAGLCKVWGGNEVIGYGIGWLLLKATTCSKRQWHPREK